jgi:hypothetical protein
MYFYCGLPMQFYSGVDSDPTCNLHDWYVGIRKGKVETLWPISARGKGY